MISFRRVAAKSTVLLMFAVVLTALAAACSPAIPSGPLPPENPAPLPPISSPAPLTPSAPQPVAVPLIGISDNASPSSTGPDVEIVLIHYFGTLKWIGCCTPMLIERDEFVVIQNRGDTAQDITGWTLANITRGYPTFRFPQVFPCMPYNVPTEKENIVIPESRYKIIQNPAQSELNRLSNDPTSIKPINNSGTCAECSIFPIDQTPMKPAAGQQGKPVPCILHPGQSILVFTDEVHCPSGGFSFNWGQGDIWNNETPDTAVLCDSSGREVSRRSYTVGR